MEIKPTNQKAFELLDKADGKADGQITVDGLKQALDTGLDGKISDKDVDRFIDKHRLSKDDAKLLKQTVKAQSTVTLIDDTLTTKDLKQLVKTDVGAAQKVLASMGAEEAEKLALSLPPKQRLALVRAMVDNPSGWSSVRKKLLESLPSGTLGELMRSGSREDIRLVALALDQSGDYKRRTLIRQFLHPPVWTSDKPGASDPHPINFFSQLALLEEIGKRASRPELRAEAMSEALWMRNMAQFLGGDKDLDHSGMNLDKRKRKEYDAAYTQRDSVMWKDNEKAQEYWKRKDVLSAYFTVPKGLAGDYEAVKGDHDGQAFPDKRASKTAVADIQHTLGDILAGDPAGVVNLIKSGKHSFTDRSLTVVMNYIISPKNADAIANLHRVFSVAAQNLHVPEGYAKMDADARARYDQWQHDAAYALGNLYAAAAVAAKDEPKDVHTAVKTVIKQAIGLIPGLKKIPAVVKDPAVTKVVEAVLGGKEADVKVGEVLDLMEEAHRVIRTLDQPGSTRLEGAFNDGASIYKYELYKTQ